MRAATGLRRGSLRLLNFPSFCGNDAFKDSGHSTCSFCKKGREQKARVGSCQASFLPNEERGEKGRRLPDT